MTNIHYTHIYVLTYKQTEHLRDAILIKQQEQRGLTGV